MNKTLLIINSFLSSKKILSLVRGFESKEWIPFIPDYKKVRFFENLLEETTGMKNISRHLQEVAARLRRPFYAVTAKMARRYNSMEWWANSISERNTMVSRLFLHCCYIYIAHQNLKKGKNLCIISDDNSVIANIVFLAKREGYDVVQKKVYKKEDLATWSLLEGFYKLSLHLGLWLVTRLNKYKCGTQKKVEKQKTDIILHTWVDEKCFGEDGQFRDRYFTILPEYYKKKGLTVSTFITFSYRNIKRSYWNALLFLRKSAESFIIPQDYYALPDYFFPFRLWFQRSQFLLGKILLEGIDCSIVFQHSNRIEHVRFETMYYLLFKRLAKKNIIPQLVVDGFENMVSDKMIQLGVKKFMPRTPVYGFYHTAPPPNVLCFFIDRNELKYVPLPDKIICNGARYKQILIGEHFPEDKIKVGAALRYLYLYKIKKANRSLSNDFRILLVLPIERDAAIELFYKLLKAMSNINNIKLILKPHPMETTIIEELKGSFPPVTEVFTGTMEGAINQCDIVVSAATSAVLDCVMADKEVIRVGRSTQIDLDPLAWFDEFGKPVSDINSLKEQLKLYKEKIKSNTYVPPQYSLLLPELFSQVTDANLKVFLPPNENW